MPETKPISLPFGNSYAFIIGNDEYQHVSKLESAVKDAKDIAKLLKDTHGYTIHSLMDGTKAQMEQMFADMLEIVKPDDRVIFYFAGHGVAVDSEKDPEGYLVPVDAESKGKEKLIPMDLLHKTLLQLPCKHGLLILDCCFSASFKWSTGFRTLFLEEQYEEMYEERFARFVQHPAWQVLTSAAADQKALDLISNDGLGIRDQGIPKTDEGNSPFAHALIQAINLQGKADVVRGNRSDGVITASELFIYVREIVEEKAQTIGVKQTPALFTLSKHNTKGEFIFIHPDHPKNLPIAPDHNPYKGLKAFDFEEEDARTFFGRTNAIQAMADKLEHASILVVSAPSGQGKSSTLKAGLLPFLQKKSAYKEANILILHPRNKQREAWRKMTSLKVEEANLILIDQYEEMFADTENEDFEDSLLNLCQAITAYQKQKQSPPPLKLILSLRSDFEWKLKGSEIGKSFWKEEEIRSFLYRLPPMSKEELREAMVKPAWTIAYEFKTEALVDQILEEIEHAPGALSLMSFALQKFYAFRDTDSRFFTKNAYDKELGGINGALSKHADMIYAHGKILGQEEEEGRPEVTWTDAHKSLMRMLLLRMVRLNDGSYSRRRVHLKHPSRILKDKALSELDYPDHEEELVEEVLEVLLYYQLIVRGGTEKDPYYEPIHDSLINFWPTCLGWIEELGRETLVLQRQLWQAVVEHHNWKPDAYSQPGAEAPLWDNHPKLQQLQLAITDPRDVWLCQKGWGEKSLSSVAWLIWQTDPLSEAQKADLLDYAWFFQEEAYQRGDYETELNGEKIFDAIQAQMDPWLNEAEQTFVKASFKKQQTEIERLKEQRDEAIRAKQEAEAAKQQIVSESIEASWKAGTLLTSPTDENLSGSTYIVGARDLYEKLKVLMSLKKVQTLSPVPIFLKGPHKEELNVHADQFGYYNPEFLDWARKHAIPAKNSPLLRKLTQPFYNVFMKEMARVYYLAYQYLERHDSLRDQVIAAYTNYCEGMKRRAEENLQINDFGGGFFLQQRLRDFPDKYERALEGTLGSMWFYFWVVGAGFWIRRHIDTTAWDFYGLLEDLLWTYDQEWMQAPPKMPE